MESWKTRGNNICLFIKSNWTLVDLESAIGPLAHKSRNKASMGISFGIVLQCKITTPIELKGTGFLDSEGVRRIDSWSTSIKTELRSRKSDISMDDGVWSRQYSVRLRCGSEGVWVREGTGNNGEISSSKSCCKTSSGLTSWSVIGGDFFHRAPYRGTILRQDTAEEEHERRGEGRLSRTNPIADFFQILSCYSCHIWFNIPFC